MKKLLCGILAGVILLGAGASVMAEEGDSSEALLFMSYALFNV